MARESKPSFRYQRRSRENVRERANMRGGNFDSLIKPQYKLFKAHDGKNVIRILPPTWDEAKHYGHDLWVNYGIGVDNQAYISLSKMKGERDPLAEAKKQADRDGDKDLSKALIPKQRVVFWLIDRNAEDEGPQLWLCPFSVDKDFINISMDEDTKEVVFVDDPEQGCDIRFYKEGTGMMTKYPAAKMKLLAAAPIQEDEKLQEEWLQYVQENPVPDCFQYYDFDHISSAFDGTARVEKADEEDDKPRNRRPSPDDEDEPKPPRRVEVTRIARPEAGEDEGQESDRPLKRNGIGHRGNDDEGEDDIPPRSRKPDPEPEAEAPRQSLRERLRARRQPDAD